MWRSIDGRHAAPDDGAFDPGPPQELGHLGDVAEHVGQVADPHRAAQVLGASPAQLEVADDRLARDEELVEQDLPRPDGQAALGDEPADQGLRRGPDLEVVVDGRRLAVEREAQPRIRRHPLEELVDQVDQAHPEHLERLVPLAVPVRVGDQVDDGLAVAGRASAGPVDGFASRLTRPPRRRSATPSRRAAAAMARWQVTMSARPSRRPAGGSRPSTTQAWKASSSSSNASTVEVHTSSCRPAPR